MGNLETNVDGICLHCDSYSRAKAEERAKEMENAFDCSQGVKVGRDGLQYVPSGSRIVTDQLKFPGFAFFESEEAKPNAIAELTNVLKDTLLENAKLRVEIRSLRADVSDFRNHVVNEIHSSRMFSAEEAEPASEGTHTG